MEYLRFTGDIKRAASEIEEYQEDEVWAVMDRKEDLFGSSSPSSAVRRVTAPRPIVRATSLGGEHHHHHRGVEVARSAPVMMSLRNDRARRIGDDEPGDDDDMIPPHVILARRYARTRVVSSMCEGVGRTLKGRDLTTLRNAVLSKTGFIE